MMHHRELDLGDDRQLVLQQQVVVAMDAAANRVLDRQHAVRRRTGVDGGEDFLEAMARNEVRLQVHPSGRCFAERPRLALICDLHNVSPASPPLG